jgi:hypothetical protein
MHKLIITERILLKKREKYEHEREREKGNEFESKL